MSVDELVLLLKTYFGGSLNSLQEQVLRCCWEGKTYTVIADRGNYEEEEVKKVASDLWKILSNIKKQPIDNLNFRSSFDLNLDKTQQDLVEYSTADTITASEFPNGPVPIDSQFYISRPPIEELAYAELVQPGSLICIKAAKKKGKSSLILRILNRAANIGYKTVNLNFQQAEKATFTNLNRFLRWFCSNISRELGKDARLDDYWDEEMGIKISCSIYFEAYLLSSLESPVVIVLNEVDLVFEHPEIASDFLPLLRSWYEQAKRVDIWQKLRVVLAYSTEIIVPLNLSQSPFNVGLPLKLPAFTKEQVQNLAQLYGLDWMDDCNTDKLMAMVGGHPYLVRLALYYLRRNKNDPESLKLLLQQAPTQAGIYNSHLRRYVLILLDNLQLKSVFCELIAANSPRKLEAIVAYKLQSMGLIELDGNNASVACELYRLYFREQLCSINNSDRAKLELRFDSNLDPLTQLINRSYFDICLQRLWQQSNKRAELSLILCDIDYFKYYNKNYGTTAGDNCLQQIANTICDRVDVLLGNGDRNSEIIARYAKDKFAVVMPVNETIAFSIAQDIKEKIQALAIESEYPGIGGLPADVITVSVGVASTIPPDIEPAALLKTAESALYQAKRKGRNCVALSQAV